MKCKICGKDAKNGDLCFDCHFWQTVYNDDMLYDKHSVAVVDRHHYTILSDDAKGMKGFSGHEFKFKFNDGTIVTSHNVWHQGNIAEADPYWQGLFPDNAIIINN